MNILGKTLTEIFALLFIAIGPGPFIMNYLSIACNLSPTLQRKLAWRTVMVGFLVAVVLLVIGEGIVEKFRLNQNVLLMAVGVSFVVKAISMLWTKPDEISPPPQMKEPLRLALSPLAVPEMMTPLGVAMLLGVSAFVSDLMSTLVFLGLVVVVLAIDFGAMVLSTCVARYITRPILEVFQQVFGFVQLAFGLRLVLTALANLGVIMGKGL